MSTPVDPVVADASLRAQMGEQAQSLAPQSDVPGIDLSQARADAVDAQALLAQLQELAAKALLAQLQELAAKAQAREDAANPVPDPPDNTLRADSNAPGWLHEVLAKIEYRLSGLEGTRED